MTFLNLLAIHDGGCFGAGFGLWPWLRDLTRGVIGIIVRLQTGSWSAFRLLLRRIARPR